MAERKLVFKLTDKFEVDVRGMSREEKIASINSFSKHDHYQVSFEGEFIHLLEGFSVNKGEWLTV